MIFNFYLRNCELNYSDSGSSLFKINYNFDSDFFKNNQLTQASDSNSVRHPGLKPKKNFRFLFRLKTDKKSYL